ncbi:hypothetical protein N1495_06260 [Streptococcus didelphis]|uniref:V-type ATP synthase subunit G n=1 Tax=Streptococcus didelphis TaxID=102886 RepID=A0ABY9LHT3_9STRE|nr:hypothetical protein [Streptococcus didelphis]WMB28388.1 hypothetical protein N1496_01835 [Streptococcus didelphis]WMB29072.1 hypothetical protein N1495_06260 [Streptococcus didelphis]
MSILSIMNTIEEEAKVIYDSYEKQKEELAAASKAELEAIRQSYEQETKDLLAAKEKELSAQKTQLERESKEKIDKNEAYMQALLADKKDKLVNQIVDKVVETYGH